MIDVNSTNPTLGGQHTLMHSGLTDRPSRAPRSGARATLPRRVHPGGRAGVGAGSRSLGGRRSGAPLGGDRAVDVRGDGVGAAELLSRAWLRAGGSGLLAVLAYYDALHAEARADLCRVDAGGMERAAITPTGTPITTWKWFRAMLEHEAHHRGQLYFTLGLLGVAAPPIYGLTEPELRARSAQRIIAAGESAQLSPPAA